MLLQYFKVFEMVYKQDTGTSLDREEIVSD